jgi:hypothetical protein
MFVCGACGYDVGGLAATAACPECGAPSVERVRRRARTRSVSWLPLAPYVVVVTAALAGGAAGLPEGTLSGWLGGGAVAGFFLSILLGIAVRLSPPLRARSSTTWVCLAGFTGAGIAAALMFMSYVVASADC